MEGSRDQLEEETNWRGNYFVLWGNASCSDWSSLLMSSAYVSCTLCHQMDFFFQHLTVSKHYRQCTRDWNEIGWHTITDNVTGDHGCSKRDITADRKRGRQTDRQTDRQTVSWKKKRKDGCSEKDILSFIPRPCRAPALDCLTRPENKARTSLQTDSVTWDWDTSTCRSTSGDRSLDHICYFLSLHGHFP